MILLAAAVRLLGLGNDNLWSDEAFSVVTSLGPPGDLLRLLSSVEPHPPLYPFLLAAWLRLFGSSEFIARLPSAIVGIASVPVAASLARAFVPPERGRWAKVAPVVAALLVAINPFQVWYSQEARMYAQVSFFAGLATLGLLRLWKGRRASALLYVVAVLGAAGSHYYGLFIPLAHGLAILVCARGNGVAVRRWLRAIGIAIFAYVPWTYLALRIFAGYYGGPPGSEDLAHMALSSWARVFAGWSLTWSDALTYAAILSAVAFIGAILPARGEDDRFLRIVLVFWLLTPFIAGYVVSLVRPLYNERYLIVSSLPLVLLLTRAIVGLLVPSPRERRLATRWKVLAYGARWSTGTLALVVVAAVALVALRNVWKGEYVKSTYDTPVRTIDLLANPAPGGDTVILDGAIQEPLYRYYARSRLPFYTLPERVPLDADATGAALDRIGRSYRGAWVLWYASDLQDPTNVIGRWLVAHAYLAYDTYGGNTRLQYYRFASDSDLSFHPAAITLGKGIELEGYAVDGDILPSGGAAAIDLRLRSLPGTPSHPRVSLRLVDEHGDTWVQYDQDMRLPSDGPASSAPLDDRHGLLVPPGTPPGTYSLYLDAYSPSGALTAQGEGAPIDPGGVRLGTIRVESPARVAWTDDLSDFQSLKASFPGGLDLLGYTATPAIQAGQSGGLTLLWTTDATSLQVSRLRLTLQAPDGKVAETRDLAFATPSFPTDQWRPGDVVREQYRLPVASSLAPGSYRLSVLPVFDSPGSAASRGEAAGPPVADSAHLGLVQVLANPHPTSTTPPGHPLADTLGQSISLDGYDLASDHVRPGGDLDLTLHWRDLASVDTDYTVFVHLLDASEKVVAQRDQPPATNQRPTSSWFPGDTVLDRYQIPLPPTLPPGDYAIEVGMYQPNDGKRLAVRSDGAAAGDRIVLGKIHVGS